MVAWPLTAVWLAAVAFEPERSFDVEVGAYASTPERFSFCLGAHAARPLELSACTGLDRGLTTVTGHAIYRKRWLLPLSGRTLGLGVGPGAGARLMRLCPYQVCAYSAGPELLLSAEAVLWLWHGVGLTVQIDAGGAALLADVVPGVRRWSFRVPVRALLGLAF
jgi:hypothetical protein